jgi:hypothetical protein
MQECPVFVARHAVKCHVYPDRCAFDFHPRFLRRKRNFLAVLQQRSFVHRRL